MLLPFVLFELPLGKVADKWLGEKEIMFGGVLITALATGACFFLTFSYALMCQPILSVFPNIGISGMSGNILESILGVKSLSTFGNIWTPPMTVGVGILGGSATGTATGSVGSLMLATIGFGLLLMSSKYVEMVEKALKTPPFPYGAAIGEALKYGAGQTAKIPASSIPKLPIPGRFAAARDKAVETSLDVAGWAGGTKPSGTQSGIP